MTHPPFNICAKPDLTPKLPPAPPPLGPPRLPRIGVDVPVAPRTPLVGSKGLEEGIMVGSELDMVSFSGGERLDEDEKGKEV